MNDWNAQDQHTYAPRTPAGWYPDGSGANRWWDGTQWTANVQQIHYQVAPRRQLPDSTPVDNAWVWVVSLACFAITPAIFLLDMRGYMNSIMTGDPLGFIGYFVWLLAITLLGWGLTALCIVAAYKDHKRLLSLGVVRPFHWAFSFIGMIVYLIGRHVVLRKVMRTPGWPLWAHLAAITLYLVGVTLWITWLIQQTIGEILYYSS